MTRVDDETLRLRESEGYKCLTCVHLSVWKEGEKDEPTAAAAEAAILLQRVWL